MTRSHLFPVPLLALAIAFAGCTHSPPESEVRPNVLIIVADDLGFSDIGALGSEIETPQIDALARGGVLLTNFHVAATCSPTRAMLLTGVDNHRNGLGNMGEFLTPAQRGQPGYEGHLNDRVATLASVLRGAGYATSMAGKWHLGREPGQRPHARGFDRSFAFLEGSGDAWGDGSAAPILGERVGFARDGEIVARPAGRFSAELYTDAIIESVSESQANAQPFFAYLAFQAVHWPHHAPDEFLERTRSHYTAGPRAIRNARLARQAELGLAFSDSAPSPMEAGIPAWEDLDAATRKDEAARMAAYAAMAGAMDAQIGRLVDFLRSTGSLDDTLILFVSDNGADPSEPERSPHARAWYERLYPKTDPEDFGRPGSFPSTGFAWARASVTPLRDHKGQAAEGGMRVPFIAHYPRRLEAGLTSDAFGYVTDIFPTVLDATGVARQGDAARLDGRTLWPLLLGQSERAHAPDEAIGYELMGNAALFRGDLKLVQRHGSDWQLFDLARDPGETRDLSESQPAAREEMLRHYREYEREMGVIPVPPDFDVMKMLLSAPIDAEAAHP